MRYRSEFTCLFLPYLTDEEELIIHNLISYLKYKHRNQILLYFTEEAKAEAKKDGLDKMTNRVICVMDAFLEEEIEDDIGLLDAQLFIEKQKNIYEK